MNIPFHTNRFAAYKNIFGLGNLSTFRITKLNFFSGEFSSLRGFDRDFNNSFPTRAGLLWKTGYSTLYSDHCFSNSRNNNSNGNDLQRLL